VKRLRRRAVAALRARPSERGFTIVEVMVATSLLSVVLASAFGVIGVMQNQSVKTSDRFSATSEAQTIADRITKDLRTAVAPSSTAAAFASADQNDVVFYANLANLNTGAGPTRLHAYVSQVAATGVYVFHEDYTQPNAGLSSPGNYVYTAAPTARLDGQYIQTSLPIFSYYDATAPIPNLILTPITTTADLRSIDQVCINLRVRVHPNSSTVVISTCIHIRNVDYNPNG
jgi:prepilin-type N-terminal cleavage/methylation domain-containing protein